jgi:hypothetical protein
LAAEAKAIPCWQGELKVAALRLAYEDAGEIGTGDEIGRVLANHMVRDVHRHGPPRG